MRTVSFSGHEYVSFSIGTAEHQLHCMALIREAGLRDVVLKDGETPEAFSQRLLDQLISARLVFELIAGWLVPADWQERIAPLVAEGYEPSPGLAWTPKVAEEIAGVLRRVTDPREIADLHVLILDLLIDFFARGTSSLWSSGQSSRGARPEASEAA